MSFRNLRLRVKIAIGCGIPMIFLVTLAVISIMASNSVQEVGQMVEHTHEVIQEAMEIEASAVDMETVIVQVAASPAVVVP